MATRAEIKNKLQLSLIKELMKVNNALVDGVNQSDIKITDVILINPRIILPQDIDNGDFEKAVEIDFVNANVRLEKDGISQIYNCDGNANLTFSNDSFVVELRVTSLKIK